MSSNQVKMILLMPYVDQYSGRSGCLLPAGKHILFAIIFYILVNSRSVLYNVQSVKLKRKGFLLVLKVVF